MTVTKVRRSGEITLPKEVRELLRVKKGDRLVFEPVGDRQVRIRVIEEPSLLSLFGALPATRPFPGKEAVREEVGRKLEGSAANPFTAIGWTRSGTCSFP